MKKTLALAISVIVLFSLIGGAAADVFGFDITEDELNATAIGLYIKL